MVLAALCAFPALRLTRLAEHLGEERSPAPLAPGRWESLLGYLLFVLLAAWSFVGSGGGPSFRPEQWTLHGPAWLMVGGGALALALYLQETRSGGAFTPGFAVAGAIGGIVGLTQALHGFLMTRIEDVAGGLAFAISSCSAALVGLATIGMPLEDRSFAADPGGAPHAATRWAWYGFPVPSDVPR